MKPRADHCDDVPSIGRSFDGVEFCPRGDRWYFRTGLRDLTVDFRALNNCESRLLNSFKRVMIWYVSEKSPAFAEGVYQRFLHFVRWHGPGAKLDEIAAQKLLSYRAALEPHEKWYLTTLAGVFRKWVKLGYGGISPDAEELLEHLTLQGNRKGEAVRTGCPIRGPLTDIEYLGTLSALRSAFESRSITREDYLLASICISFAARPVQIAALKTCDFVNAGDDGEGGVLSIPRVKQPGKLIRSEFRTRPMIARLAGEIQRHVNEVRTRLSSVECPQGLPLFPTQRPINDWSAGFEWHSTAREMSRRVQVVLESLSVHSERTGLPMRQNAARIRRTIGTRAAAEGRGLLVIADILDHSDTQNVEVYVEARPDIVDRLDEAMAEKLAPLARAFAGEFEDAGGLGNARGGRISDPQFGSHRSLGRCGRGGPCSLLAPTGCYTCTSFRAWRDGPHREVLAHLVAERDRLQKVVDERVAAIGDRTILAVAEVVSLCGGTDV